MLLMPGGQRVAEFLRPSSALNSIAAHNHDTVLI
jgi:hypothetical protein